MADDQQQAAARTAAMEVRRRTDEAVARLPLVELLFGVGSPTATAGGEMVNAVGKALLEAEKPQPLLTDVRDHSHLAADKLEEFIRAAHERVT